eukprot:TRINITY_DN27343_c0_g1_i1.p1 TRINITY_DN27343_c0_g1~~TRINITY_DN27343_c0_g1_i1.p1  ORF type:complete len:1624 (+),score=722.97 TRINITY_DN27343_c0_g1_i1:111-4874(+)
MPLETFKDPPHIARKFNMTKHNDTATFLEQQEEVMRETVMRTRKERLREAEHARRGENAIWEQEGRKAHRENMRTFRSARAEEVELEEKVQRHKTARMEKAKENARTAMLTGIDNFETNMQRLGIGQEGHGGKGNANFDDTEYIQRIRQRKQEEVSGRKERTKRRQKMLLDQQRVYRSIYERQKQEQLLEKVLKQSSAERAIGEELAKQAQARNEMVARRRFREAQYEARRAADQEEHKSLIAHARQRELELYEAARTEELSKVKALLTQKEEAKAAKRHQMCADITSQLLTLVDKVVDFRERTADFKSSVLGGAPLVPLHTWNEWLLQFVTGTDDVEPAEALPVCDEEEGDEGENDGASAAGTEARRASKAPSAAPENADGADEKSQTAPTPSVKGEEDGVVSPDVEVLKLLNDADISAYLSHSKNWATVEKPPHGSEYNTLLCNMMAKVAYLLTPPPKSAKRVDRSPFMLCVFMGKNLTGKSACAKHAAEELKFVHAAMKDIVSGALGACSGPALEAATSLEGEAKTLAVERVELARAAKQELDEGKEIGDMLLAKLVLNHFNAEKLQAVEDEGAMAARRSSPRPNTTGADSASPSATPDKLDDADALPPSVIQPRGMILEGFPKTTSQFEALEALMTTWEPEPTPPHDTPLAPLRYAQEPKQLMAPLVPTPPKDATNADEEPQDAAPPADGDAESEPPAPVGPAPVPELTAEERELIAHGEEEDETAIDVVLNFEATDTEIFARHAGERMDPVTRQVYHIEYNPPPDEVFDRLQSMDVSVCDKALIHHKLTAFKHHKKRVLRWLERVGTFREVDANRPLDAVQAGCLDIMKEVIRARHAHDTKCAQREALLESRAKLQEAFEQEARELAEANEAEQAENPDAPPPADGAKKVSFPVALTAEVADTLQAQWGQINKTFLAGVSEIFVEQRKLKRDTTEHFILVGKQFHQHLAKPTMRQAKVEAFQLDFNAFDAEIRREKDGKAELHLRTDGLQAQLWKESDARKEDSLAMLAESRKAPWNDLFQTSAAIQYVALLEVEVTRFVMTKRLVQFYFSTLYYTPLKVDDAIPDLSPPADDGGKGGAKAAPKKAAPKKGGKGAEVAETNDRVVDFRRFYEKALEWLEEVVQDTGEKAPEAPAKGGKAAPPATPSPEETRRLEVEAMAKEVWGREAELLKYRLEVVCAKYYECIEEVEAKSGELYENLTNSLKDLYQREMATTAALISYIRTHIEEETRLAYECDVSGNELVVNQSSLLVTPTVPENMAPPPIGDGNDFITADITMSHMAGMVSAFRSRAPEGQIAKETFVRLFLQLTASSVQGDAAPECWSEFGVATFESVFGGFDWETKGACDWRLFCVSLLLWSGEVGNSLWVGAPTLLELVNLKEALCGENGEAKTHITKAELLAAPFWFSSSVSQTRADQLKMLLWKIFEGYAPAEHAPGPAPAADVDPEAADAADDAAQEEAAVTAAPAEPTIQITTFLLYLCPDKQILRGAQKAFAMVAAEQDLVSRRELYTIFHFSPYTTADGFDDAYSAESIDAVFHSVLNKDTDEPEEERISFAQLIACHVGRVMLNNARSYLQRQVTFKA